MVWGNALEGPCVPTTNRLHAAEHQPPLARLQSHSLGAGERHAGQMCGQSATGCRVYPPCPPELRDPPITRLDKRRLTDTAFGDELQPFMHDEKLCVFFSGGLRLGDELPAPEVRRRPRRFVRFPRQSFGCEGR